MSRVSRRSFLAGMAVGAAAFNLPVTMASAQSPAAAGRRPKHVLLIDLDGFDPDYLGRAPMPNLAGLIDRGSLSTARGTYTTISNPSRASMSTGAFPEVHGNSASYFDPVTNRAVGQTRFLAAETLAQSLAAEGRTLASVQWYMVQNHGATYGDPEHLYVQPGGSIETRVDVAIDILNRRPVRSAHETVTIPQIPDFLALHASTLDDVGHAEGAESPLIPAALTEVDRQLGRLVQATKDVGVYGDTAFVLTSDHGMTSWSRAFLPEVVEAIRARGYAAEIVRGGGSPSADTDVIAVPFARLCDFTLRGRAAEPAGRADVRAAIEAFAQTARVHDKDGLRRLRAGDKHGDLVAEAEPPWAFSTREPAAPRGQHGTLAEIEVPLLLAGAGIRRGAAPQGPRLVDVAPTISALLGVRPPAQAQGRALAESIGAPGAPTA